MLIDAQKVNQVLQSFLKWRVWIWDHVKSHVLHHWANCVKLDHFAQGAPICTICVICSLIKQQNFLYSFSKTAFLISHLTLSNSICPSCTTRYHSFREMLKVTNCDKKLRDILNIHIKVTKCDTLDYINCNTDNLNNVNNILNIQKVGICDILK